MASKKSILDTPALCYNTFMTITNRIRFWRQQRGWSLQQLAVAAGTTRAQIDKLERGSRRLTVDWLVRLAAPLGCDPRSLMALHESGNTHGFSEAVQTPLQHDIPLYRLTLAAQRQSHRIAPHPAGSVPCPAFLLRVAQTYALEVKRALPNLPGQILFVSPSAKPKIGAWLLAQNSDGFWHLGACQKLSATSLKLSAANPRGHLVLKRKHLHALHGVAAIVNLPLAALTTNATPRRGKPRDRA